MFIKGLIAVGAILVIILVYGAVKPADFTIQRSIRVEAQAERIFPHINHLKRFDAWNPWSKQDPNIKMSYDGPEEGVGAKSSWVSDKIGEGSMTIVNTAAPTSVQMKLEFVKPFPGTNDVEFRIVPDGYHSKVSWMMKGQMAYIPRVMSIFFSMDKMMGSEFEKGLAQLKTIVESEGK